MSLAIGVVGVGRDHAVAIVDPVYPKIWIAARDGDAASVDEFVRVPRRTLDGQRRIQNPVVRGNNGH